MFSLAVIRITAATGGHHIMPDCPASLKAEVMYTECLGCILVLKKCDMMFLWKITFPSILMGVANPCFVSRITAAMESW